MVKINLEVQLDNQSAAYYPEQTVSGTVWLNIKHDLKVKAINVKLKGHAYVSWTEESGEDGGNTNSYSAEETYCDVTRCLLSPADGEGDIILKPGTYKYPFHFQLPKEIPSSFAGYYGWVRYLVEAQVARPRSLDCYYTRFFSVATVLDLNTQKDLMHPAKSEDSKQLCCWCCISDPITATMQVHDRIGYVPGETIVFSSEISNRSGRTMKKSVAKLIMFVKYYADSSINTMEYVLTELSHGPIEPGGMDSWIYGKLHIPPVPPSSMPYCSLMDITYYAVMSVVPAGPAYNLDVPVEVVIGTVPLKQFTDRNTLPAAPDSDFAAGNPYTDTTIQAPFAESAFGHKSTKDNEDDGHRSGNKNFTPAYPYYNWNRPDPISNFTVRG